MKDPGSWVDHNNCRIWHDELTRDECAPGGWRDDVTGSFSDAELPRVHHQHWISRAWRFNKAASKTDKIVFFAESITGRPVEDSQRTWLNQAIHTDSEDQKIDERPYTVRVLVMDQDKKPLIDMDLSGHPALVARVLSWVGDIIGDHVTKESSE